VPLPLLLGQISLSVSGTGPNRRLRSSFDEIMNRAVVAGVVVGRDKNQSRVVKSGVHLFSRAIRHLRDGPQAPETCSGTRQGCCLTMLDNACQHYWTAGASASAGQPPVEGVEWCWAAVSTRSILCTRTNEKGADVRRGDGWVSKTDVPCSEW